MTALNGAVELLMAGRLEEARRACRKAVQQRPDVAEGHMLLAEISSLLGDAARARESALRVLRLRPGWNEARVELALGDLYADFGRHDDAERKYRRAAEIDPALGDARFNLAGLLDSTGRTDEAIDQLRVLTERRPDERDAHERLLSLLFKARRIDELEAASRRAIARHPGAAAFPNRLGTALLFQGRLEEAIQAMQAAVRLAASEDERRDTHLNLANALLASGRYAEAWPHYRWRHSRAAAEAAHPELLDDPSALSRLERPARVRIVAEQGLGDEIFFLRFAQALRDRGHRLALAAEPRLLSLLEGLFEPPDAPADHVICSGDLPLASGRAFAPPLALVPQPKRRVALGDRLKAFGPPPYIGVTWRAGVLPDEPKPQRGAYMVKELPLEPVAHALRPLDARIVVLQRRPLHEELARFAAALGREVLDLSAVNGDLRDAVAALSLLDDYVGPSNTNFHLRVGLPQPRQRVLVNMPAEWRWGMAGDASAWFPGTTVYRRAFGAEWDGAMAILAADLRKTYAAMQQE